MFAVSTIPKTMRVHKCFRLGGTWKQIPSLTFSNLQEKWFTTILCTTFPKTKVDLELPRSKQPQKSPTKRDRQGNPIEYPEKDNATPDYCVVSSSKASNNTARIYITWRHVSWKRKRKGYYNMDYYYLPSKHKLCRKGKDDRVGLHSSCIRIQ